MTEDARIRHHRDRDHDGEDLDSFVGLSAPIGPWEIGTPIKYVLFDLYTRFTALESSNHHLGSITVDAYALAPGSFAGSAPGTIRGLLSIDAIVKKSMSGSITIDAEVVKGGSITIDAWVRPTGSITIDAYVV